MDVRIPHALITNAENKIIRDFGNFSPILTALPLSIIIGVLAAMINVSRVTQGLLARMSRT